jgi:hypothetical protein
MALFGRKSKDGERAEALFSPYLDGQVSAEERRFLERYLAAHAEARAQFEMLKRAVQLTKALPPVRAPRSFVLPRSMARKPSATLRMYAIMRFATAAAMVLFAFAIVGDLATSSQLSAPAAPNVALLAEATEEAAATEAPLPDALRSAMPTTTAEPAAEADAADTTSTAAPTGTGAGGETTAQATPASETALAAQATEAPAAESEEDGARDKSAVTAADVPQEAPVDPLRVVEIGLAGLVVVLLTTTLILRQRMK